MKLFLNSHDKKLFSQYKHGNDLSKQKVVLKIFNPYGAGRWYILNSDPKDPDYLWAIVEMNGTVEIGSVSRKDLEDLRVGKWKLPLEREMYETFKETADETYKNIVEEYGYQAPDRTPDPIIEPTAIKKVVKDEEDYEEEESFSEEMIVSELLKKVKNAVVQRNKTQGYEFEPSREAIAIIQAGISTSLYAGIPKKWIEEFMFGQLITTSGESKDEIVDVIWTYQEDSIAEFFVDFANLWSNDEYESGFKYMDITPDALKELGFERYKSHKSESKTAFGDTYVQEADIYITTDFTHVYSVTGGYSGLYSDSFEEGFEMAKKILKKATYVKDVDFFKTGFGGVGMDLSQELLIEALQKKANSILEDMDKLADGGLLNPISQNSFSPYSETEASNMIGHFNSVAESISNPNNRELIEASRTGTPKIGDFQDLDIANSDLFAKGGMLNLSEYADSEEFNGTAIQKDANEIIDWIYDQKWSGATKELTNKLVDKINTFEQKHDVKVVKAYAKGGQIDEDAYQKFLKAHKVYEAESDKWSDELQRFPKNEMGLIPQRVRDTEEYKTAKSNYHRAFKMQQEFAKVTPKEYLKRMSQENREARTKYIVDSDPKTILDFTKTTNGLRVHRSNQKKGTLSYEAVQKEIEERESMIVRDKDGNSIGVKIPNPKFEQKKLEHGGNLPEVIAASVSSTPKAGDFQDLNIPNSDLFKYGGDIKEGKHLMVAETWTYPNTYEARKIFYVDKDFKLSPSQLNDWHAILEDQGAYTPRTVSINRLVIINADPKDVLEYTKATNNLRVKRSRLKKGTPSYEAIQSKISERESMVISDKDGNSVAIKEVVKDPTKSLEKGGTVRKSKYTTDDMVYSWQNPDHKARISHVHDRGVQDGVDYGFNYKVSLPKDEKGNYDPKGEYRGSSKWISEDSISKTKKPANEYEKGGDVPETKKPAKTPPKNTKKSGKISTYRKNHPNAPKRKTIAWHAKQHRKVGEDWKTALKRVSEMVRKGELDIKES